MGKTRPHVLVLPYPAQGHVLPLMEFSLQLIQNGIKVTFVNTDFYHQMILKSLPEGENLLEFMNMVSLPDGLESIGNGVPFLCWPYFADQFLNESYICDEWEVGLWFDREESGIISRKEIKDKVERVITDKSYKARALELQAKTAYGVSEGSSQENLNNFIEGIKKL